MSDLRIFSYLPNPRIWKATIAARLCQVEVEVRGTSPKELASWLWDFDARPLAASEASNTADAVTGKVGLKGTLHKTRAFLEAHPFGTVPAAFSPDGSIGIFESNSIMRAVARIGADRFPLYGHGPYEAARVDSFLDASLVFARDSQVYLLALISHAVSPEIHARTRESFDVYAGGIDQALAGDRKNLVSDNITLADICFVAELCLFHNENARSAELEQIGLVPILRGWKARYPRAYAHFTRLCGHSAFAPDVEPYLRKIGVRQPALG
jgi:elongation factor 1-gamma